MLGVIEGFGLIAIVILSGFILAKWSLKSKALPENTFVILNKYAFYLGYPCLMVSMLSRKNLHELLGLHLGIAILTAAACAILFLIFNKLFLHTRGSEGFLVCLGAIYLNSNNIGLPVATYLLKDPTMIVPIMLFQIVFLAPLALIVLDASKNGKPSIAKAIKSIFSPMVVGIFLGLIGSIINMHQIPVLDFFGQVADMIGASAVPCVLVSYGMSLAGSKFFENKRDLKIVSSTTFFKIIVMPLVTYFIVKYGFGIEGALLYSYTVSAALPTAQNVFNFSVVYNNSVPIVRDTVFISTILSPFAILAITALLGV